MTRGQLLRAIDKGRVVEAIRQAEKRTSGEIRVSVSTLIWGDVQGAAEKAFARMGMTATKDRNAVLFFVVPARRMLVVFGDMGIDQKAGHDFWKHVVNIVLAHFKRGDFTGGLVQGIGAAGEQLAKQFPHTRADTNELPDALDFGGKR